MSNTDPHQANQTVLAAWRASAAFWDERMTHEGNDFVNVLIWPAIQRLLDLRPGQRVLDVACGNGLYARRLAALGAEVVAFDFAPEMIEIARIRTAQATATEQSADRNPTQDAAAITYAVLDATDEAGLLALGEGSFDAAICPMALMDMADIKPLLTTLPRLLRPGGCFIFAITHPCFNHANMSMVAERRFDSDSPETVYAVKVHAYMTPSVTPGVAIIGQPQAHLYFDRPLHLLLGACFEAGFVLDALEERAFPPDHPPGRDPFSWSGHYSEIPPVLLARLRPKG